MPRCGLFFNLCQTQSMPIIINVLYLIRRLIFSGRNLHLNSWKVLIKSNSIENLLTSYKYINTSLHLSDKMDALGTGNLTGAQKDELMEKVKQEMALANFQELLTKITEKCFKQCIQKPGTNLDNSEQKCVAMCMDRYIDAYNTVSKAYSNRIQIERN